MKNGETPGFGRVWVINGLAITACLLVIFYLVWRGEARERNLGQPGHPLVFMLSHEHGRLLTPDDRQALVNFLERESGLRIDVRVAGSSLEAIESFGAQADVGLVNLFDYILARREYNVEAVLQVLRGTASADYRGAIVVREKDPYHQLADLKGGRLAFVDPFSTSGFIFPAKLLKDAGVTVVAEFAGGHDNAMERLKTHQADAIATYIGAAETDSSLRVLATTEPIPNEPVIARRGVRPEKVARVVAALSRLAGTPEGLRLLALMADISGLRPITNDHYDNVVGVARSAGATVYDLVPEGIQVESRRRGIDLVPL